MQEMMGTLPSLLRVKSDGLGQEESGCAARGHGDAEGHPVWRGAVAGNIQFWLSESSGRCSPRQREPRDMLDDHTTTPTAYPPYPSLASIFLQVPPTAPLLDGRYFRSKCKI